MKYIEFIGAPGAGKSTFAREAITILRAQGQSVFDKYDARCAAMLRQLQTQRGLIWQLARLAWSLRKQRISGLLWEKQRYALAVRFVAAHPALTRIVLECAEHVTPPAWIPQEIVCGKNLIEWFWDAATTYQAAQETLAATDIFLFEEGFAQYAYYPFAFFDGALNQERLDRYLQHLPKPDLFVALLPTPEACEARMHGRAKGVASDILTPLSAPQRLAILQERTAFNETIAAYWERQRVTMIRLENDDYERTKQSLADQLAAYCSQ